MTSKEEFTNRINSIGRSKLLKVARNHCWNIDKAEDVLQDSYLSAWVAWEDYKEDNFAAWMGRIITNAARLQHQRSTVVKRGGTDTAHVTLDDTDALAVVADCGSPLEIAIADNVESRISKAVEALPAKLQDVFKRYHMNDNTYKSIADDLAIPVSKVRARLHKARTVLKSRVQECECI